MSIKLSKEQSTTLLIGLTEGFQSRKPEHTFLLATDLHWAEDLAAGLGDDTKAKLERFVGERPLATFIKSEIDRLRMAAGDVMKLDPNQPLTQIKLLSDPLQAAREMVEQLQTLPRRYRVTAALPMTFSNPLLDHIDSYFSLPNGIFICRGDSFPQQLEISSASDVLDKDLFKDWIKGTQTDRTWRDNRLYFSARLIGYAAASQSGALNRQIEDQITAFYGAATAIGMISYDWLDGKDNINFMTVHEEPSGAIVKTNAYSDAFRAYYPFIGTGNYAAKHSETLRSQFKASIERIATIFNETIDCRKLFSACIWYYRARRNTRILDAHLQYTIAIEVLLGDRKASEGIGLTNLLASRCAYLLGRSTEHRERLERQFRDVYELRSEIMHDGRHVQKVGDRARVDTASKLCGAIISRELAIRAAAQKNSG